jgi:hypothetical protein
MSGAQIAALAAPAARRAPCWEDGVRMLYEAIGATVYALMREQVRRGGPESIGAVVPLATYITLVGFVGADRALAVANGRPERR